MKALIWRWSAETLGPARETRREYTDSKGRLIVDYQARYKLSITVELTGNDHDVSEFFNGVKPGDRIAELRTVSAKRIHKKPCKSDYVVSRSYHFDEE